MKYFQILEQLEKTHHAGSKAVADVSAILEEQGFEPVVILDKGNSGTILTKIYQHIWFSLSWLISFFKVTSGATVVLQHPFHKRQFFRRLVLYLLKKLKGVQFISLIHDVEELRQTFFTPYYQKEFTFMVTIADVIIVHNDVMKQFFISKGVSKERIVVLGIFDYLHDHTVSLPQFSRSITIAGNLDPIKAGYIARLGELDGVKVDLYGVNYHQQLDCFENITYHGVLPAEDVPKHLTRGFGLIWDGDELETCSGATGNYLRFNNPHKLSLYLSSGLPVIIWKEAALAKFVEEHQVGLVLDDSHSLYDRFEQLSHDTYQQLTHNVATICNKLREGRHTSLALESAKAILSKDSLTEED